MEQPDFKHFGCQECAKGCDLDFDFTMAFQPIVDVENQTVFAHEALVRGINGEGAGHVFENVNSKNRYRFDQSCRVKAIKLAAELEIESNLCINFLPNAIYKPELCIRTTLAAAEKYGFDAKKIIFEFTENERIQDHDHLISIIRHYQKLNFQTAIDDFGSGYNGLTLLANTPTDIAKLDMALIRDIDQSPIRQAIVKHNMDMFHDLGIKVIAEGIETQAEYQTLRKFGVTLYQGYYFAKPSFESLAVIHWPE
ncbi:EAL domain-containing protein [Marinomonas piezotolerans]|uniref:EAL domain-containing protein n=1 Tax=Marinomonas piezotolerans TaxID=2213058 RepID=A0A370U7M4_9GAMM|nr:EAL domain-containing protein [Marinomonas piezotolerans]RDL43777.1 EAL domain-containing protein [Marinomonas piezotolerans]